MPSKNEKMQKVDEVLATIRMIIEEEIDLLSEQSISETPAITMVETAVELYQKLMEEGWDEKAD